jgi:hypothetical protein
LPKDVMGRFKGSTHASIIEVGSKAHGDVEASQRKKTHRVHRINAKRSFAKVLEGTSDYP